MSPKKIKSYAIVPQELYVTREADRQLRQIIEDMGRPGYVLVSRQMGKTNLLLNAKRDFDSSDNCFCYLDVSNSFSDLRSFFRNIIDTVLSGKVQLFEALSIKIKELRKVSEGLQPHKEHELELREILDVLPGKLIICLDEIDALTKVDYSDNVFSLIRSIYFSGRTNFPQFAKLTYVLSGVADPADLIKNKAISPFNIGEKIYLNDFTIAETKRFIEQCSLSLNDETIDRVYYWTAGSPRVTWDVCSAIESEVENNPSLDPDSIDRHVKRLYLTDFDLPPFDHIRARVEGDREIRNAVMSMHYGKSTALSDKVKDKLYLAGISTPKQKDGSVNFRNKIMAESLSEKWISDIESELLTLDERATDKLKAEKYDEAILLYQELLAESDNPDGEIATKLNIGYCYTQLEKFDAALDIFESCELKGSQNQALLDVKAHWSGICYLCSNRLGEAIDQFRKLVYPEDEKHQSVYYYEACVNLASALMVLGSQQAGSLSESSAEIQELLMKAINSVDESPRSGKPIATRDILYTANYQLGRYYAGNNDPELGMRYIEEALKISSDDIKSTLYLELAKLEGDKGARIELYKKCCRSFIASRASLSGGSRLNPLWFGVDECAELLFNLVVSVELAEAKALVEYIESGAPKQKISGWDLCSKALLVLVTRGEYEVIPSMVRLALLFSTSAPYEEVSHLLVLGLIISKEKDDSDLAEAYLSNYLGQSSYIISDFDFRAVAHLIFNPLKAGEYEKCHHILDLADAAFERMLRERLMNKEVVRCGALVLLHLRIKVNAYSGAETKISECLLEFLPSILGAKNFSLPYFPDNYGEILDADFRRLVHEGFYSQANPQMPAGVRNSKKIGRNQLVKVKYPDGSMETGKFKKYIAALEKGECKLIED